MKNKNLLTTVAVSALCLGVGFFAGTKYQPSPNSEFVNQFNQRNNRDQQPGMQRNQIGNLPGGQNRGQGMRPLSGEITSSDGKTLTVKILDGSSKIVMVSTTTQINKALPGQATDLKIGEKVSVFGVLNADGSVVAQNIQINPLFPNASPSAALVK